MPDGLLALTPATGPVPMFELSEETEHVESPDRRQEILDGAARLLAQRGITGCTVRGIAEEVGILAGSLYYHFDSKDAIVEEIVAGYLAQLADRCAEVVATRTDGRTRLQELVAGSLEVSHANAAASDIYQANRSYFADDERFARIRLLAAQVQHSWMDVIEAGIREGSFRGDTNKRVFHRYLRDAVFLSSRWFVPTETYLLADLAADISRIFLDGFTRVPEESTL